ncbi:hypothetical protein AGMMS49942_12360 [Spirochaetia bacterium]|nr:hypothetical protein AGMMS49942_12360 [Spirochaetia bacterium]
MKLDEDKTIYGVFEVAGDIFSGRIIVSPNNHIKLILTTTYRQAIDDKYFGQNIPIIHGTTIDPTNRITIIDTALTGKIGPISGPKFGLLQYTFLSNVLIIGEYLEENTLLDNLCLCSADLNKYLGNYLSEASFHFTSNLTTANISLPCEKDINNHSSSEIKIKLSVISNIEKQNLHSKFSIEPLYLIILEYASQKQLYPLIDYTFLVETFLSFIFQKDCALNEVAYFRKKQTIDFISGKNKDYEIYHHIYYKHDEVLNKEYNEKDVLYPNTFFSKHFSQMLYNWYKLMSNIEYMRYFVLNYFKIKYIDQKIIAQINLFEALHKHYYGVKQDGIQINERNQSILSQIGNTDDKVFIESILRSKNGFGMRKKLDDICKKSGLNNLTRQEIESINIIRSKFSHGTVDDNFDIEKYRSLNKKLNEIIICLIKKEIELDIDQTQEAACPMPLNAN